MAAPVVPVSRWDGDVSWEQQGTKWTAMPGWAAASVHVASVLGRGQAQRRAQGGWKEGGAVEKASSRHILPVLFSKH